MLHPNAQKIQTALDTLGLSCKVQELPGSTATSAEAAAALGVTVSEIAKSLIFQSQDSPVLVIASGTNRVSVPKLEKLTGAPIKRADPNLVKEKTGFPIGGVPPLAHLTKLQTFVDEDLLSFQFIWAAAGTPRSVFRCTPNEFVQMTGAVVAQIKEGETREG